MGAPVIELLVIGVVLLGIWFLLVVGGYFYISGTFKIRFEPLADADLEAVVRKVLAIEGVDPQWLEQNEFQPVGACKIAYPLSASATVIWKHAGENTFLFVSEMSDMPEESRQIEFQTPLVNGALTTGSTKLSLAQFPEAGFWYQAFQSLDLAALYARHADALTYVVKELGQPRVEGVVDPLHLVKAAMSRGFEFLTRQRFWPLRIPYWSIVLLLSWQRRFNKSIREQVAQFGTSRGLRSNPHPD